MTTCEHILEAQDPAPRTPEGCEECLATGSRWVHLRKCLSCGHIGCCDSSPNKHATAHFLQTNDPVIVSFEPGEDWRWCYVDSVIG
ncbi:ubiquitin carboxyl-terminal hydrolase 14 [Streptosporangium sp. G11]|uniref:ubiquitin carboxyl-terminal hydrolase 14 n=1 Tax=Streptosporangium sp. G11 TaxID=3436926 RepID=UPI003EBF635D